MLSTSRYLLTSYSVQYPDPELPDVFVANSKAEPWEVVAVPLHLNIVFAWSIVRSCFLYAVKNAHLASGEYKNDVLRCTRAGILHFVYFTQRDVPNLT